MYISSIGRINLMPYTWEGKSRNNNRKLRFSLISGVARCTYGAREPKREEDLHVVYAGEGQSRASRTLNVNCHRTAGRPLGFIFVYLHERWRLFLGGKRKKRIENELQSLKHRVTPFRLDFLTRGDFWGCSRA